MTIAFNVEFEKPIVELEQQIEHLKRLAADRQLDVNDEIEPLETKLADLRREIYQQLTPMQRVQVARHPKRPYVSTMTSCVSQYLTEARFAPHRAETWAPLLSIVKTIVRPVFALY